MPEKKPSKTKQSAQTFTAEERAAMKEIAAERKAQRSGKADGEADVLAKIAEMPVADRKLAERIHAIVKATAPGRKPLTKVLTVVQGSTEGLSLSPGTTSANKALADAGAGNFSFRWDAWYKKMDDECRQATNELMFQGGTADKFCDRMQAVADAVKADSSIEKFQR